MTTRRSRRPAGLLALPQPRGLALICAGPSCWPRTEQPCRHARLFLMRLGDAVSVRAAYAFGDWPPAVRP